MIQRVSARSHEPEPKTCSQQIESSIFFALYAWKVEKEILVLRSELFWALVVTEDKINEKTQVKDLHQSLRKVGSLIFQERLNRNGQSTK